VNVQLKVVVVIFGLVLLALLGSLIRRGRMRPEYSLFWLIALAAATGMVALDRPVLAACRWLGPEVVPFGLLSLGLSLFLAALCFHLCARVSVLREQAVVLDQRAAHLEAELTELRAALRRAGT
jgi:hypothetical protein